MPAIAPEFPMIAELIRPLVEEEKVIADARQAELRRMCWSDLWLVHEAANMAWHRFDAVLRVDDDPGDAEARMAEAGERITLCVAEFRRRLQAHIGAVPLDRLLGVL